MRKCHFWAYCDIFAQHGQKLAYTWNFPKILGEGAFGLVCKGSLRGPKGMGVRVAIKQLKTNAIDEEREEFHREIEIMKQANELHDFFSKKKWIFRSDVTPTS